MRWMRRREREQRWSSHQNGARAMTNHKITSFGSFRYPWRAYPPSCSSSPPSLFLVHLCTASMFTLSSLH